MTFKINYPQKRGMIIGTGVMPNVCRHEYEAPVYDSWFEWNTCIKSSRCKHCGSL